MNKKNAPFKTVFMRNDPACAISTQRSAAIEWGADPNYIFEYKRNSITLKNFLDSLRQGDWVGIYSFELFVPRGEKFTTRRGAELRKIADQLMDYGVVVHELKTGRSCKDRKEMIGMYDDALRRLAGDRNQKAGPGRPKKHSYSKRDYEIMNGIWRNKDYSNPYQRIDAIKSYQNDAGEKPYSHLSISTFYLHVKDKDKPDNGEPKA